MTPAATPPPLHCPACRCALVREEAAWRCDSCCRRYAQRDGVVSFLDAPDPFYEGRFDGTVHALLPRTLAGRLTHRMRVAWALDRHFPALLARFLRAEHRRVLDVGCGGGHTELTAEPGRAVTGLDLSFASLRAAAHYYACTVQCPAERMPFADGSFDAVVSSNFLGHVPGEGEPASPKDAVLAEMARVLAPGGLMLHQLETSSEGALFRFARRDADFYRRSLVEIDGHVGLELPSEALARFRRHGLRVLYARPDFAWYLIPHGEALKRFDDPVARRSAMLRVLLALDRRCAGRPRVIEARNLAVGVLNEIALSLMPLDRGIGLRVALRKENG